MPAGVPFNEKNKAWFLKLVGEGKSPRTAAALVDISFDSTVKKHLTEDPEFYDRFTAACELASAAVEDVLYDEAKGGNMAAVKMWLYNRNPTRWRDETVLRKEITGPNGGPIQIVQGHVMALREVLTDADTRDGALSMVAAIPATGHEVAVREDGDPRPPGGHSDS